MFVAHLVTPDSIIHFTDAIKYPQRAPLERLLANNMRQEDTLASCCIAIPIRRTNRKLSVFPPTYDGAPIRHKLYTRALTNYTSIYENYAQRPELHTLNKRSRELWSTLMALAVFSEDQGEVEGLIEAIQKTVKCDVLISEGKALSQQEEAVLLTLDILTRDT